ncbi:hypothetical protein [Sinimarinibacterium sp. NLF-5-8]|uniref:hypothetical protein n=1 Tax=Sinimarinibacterium sp. NLF-5-8 TaxID=2698684 RepID=UPI00137C3441|nr:hypothetical protein [Sinimarinibacterium sp. NLF-5-8]QHS08996.1 hypothetical protein GT972_01795 [Sinimarinibacterium sp. NLF-5-8]
MQHRSCCYIGIDPGAKGGLAMLDTHGGALFADGRCSTSAISVADALRSALAVASENESTVIAAIEKTAARPGQGVASMHQFGRNAGWWEGALAALQVPYSIVTPQRWQKLVLDSASGATTKQRSVAQAQRFWPTLALRKTDDGLADALHIARWCLLANSPPQ